VTPVRILALADEVDGSLGFESIATLRPDLVVSCGDLPFDYLEFAVTVAGVPLLFVPGNHDPDVAPRSENPLVAGSLALRFRTEDVAHPGPRGCTNVDGKVVEAAGLRVAGLGGSVRYREGPNQYTQAEMRRRARRLRLRWRLRGLGRLSPVDVLVAHAPPLGVGDAEDPAHAGFEAFHSLVERLRPRLLLHGHVHPYGLAAPDRMIGDTLVVNAVGSRVIEVEPWSARASR
jgi:hypothetical protein